MPKAVFVPGLLCTRELFASQKHALRDVLEMTIGDHRNNDNFTRMAERILGDAPERFVYAGLSMGGHAGFEIMRQAPERIEALILMNTSARPDAPEQRERRMGLIEVAKREGLSAVADELLPVFLAEKNLGNRDLTDSVRHMAIDTGVEAFERQQAAIMGRADSRGSLSQITCPTLVIVGNRDTLTPPELAREMVDGIPGAELKIIDDCGHLSSIEQPDAVSEAIKTFLEEARIAA
jgi:pimeloyl-ACP methyl ester carboxylesterase